MRTKMIQNSFVALAAASALALAGCSTSTGKAEHSEESAEAAGTPVIAVSSYPLQYIAETVGGKDAQILNLAANAGHTHDMELSPAQVKELSDASVALYLSQGFQPAVEKAIQESGVQGLDGFSVVPENQVIEGDPHMWLNPVNVGLVGQALAEDLAEVSPEHAEDYKKNADALTADMNLINSDYRAALASCSGQSILTTHEAFGYMAAAYDLEQIGLLGIDPEAEPSPARILEVKNLVEEKGLSVLFVEPAGAEHDHDHDHDHEGEDHDHEGEQSGDDHDHEGEDHDHEGEQSGDEHDHDHEGEDHDHEGEQSEDHDHDHAAEEGRTVSAASRKLAASIGLPAVILDPMEVQIDPSVKMPALFHWNLKALQEGLSCATK